MALTSIDLPTVEESMGSNQSAERPALRVDKWLWFARFYKSRAQATAAVAGGLVHVNGERIKASRALHVDDRVTITRQDAQIDVVVTGLPVRRGPAPEAQAHYVETPESIARREERKRLHAAMPAPPGRPDKHARRALRGLRRQ
jgi:ribosome-associated heat shock protein Hsp15